MTLRTSFLDRFATKSVSAPKLALAMWGSLWQKPRAPADVFVGFADTRCGSSVVEHSIGNGEVDSSILSRSTIKSIS
jgi:hypothetical protein